MKKSFMIEYLCRDEFRKKEESLKKYYMNENIIFVYYPWFREGKFFGKRVKQNKVDEYDEFELYLPANEIAIYEKKFGALVLHYRVYYNKRIVMLMNIAPSERAKERMK